MAKKNTKASGEAKSEGINKSQFIRDHFQQKPNATARDIVTAFAEAGHGVLNPMLVYLVKSKSAEKKRRRGKTERGGADGVGIRTSDDAANVYLQIETELEKLIVRAPDKAVAEALRLARRRVSAKLVE